MRNIPFGIATQAIRRANTADAHHGRISFTPAFLFHQTVCFTDHPSLSGSTVAEKRSRRGLHGHAALKATHKNVLLAPTPRQATVAPAARQAAGVKIFRHRFIIC